MFRKPFASIAIFMKRSKKRLKVNDNIEIKRLEVDEKLMELVVRRVLKKIDMTTLDCVMELARAVTMFRAFIEAYDIKKEFLESGLCSTPVTKAVCITEAIGAELMIELKKTSEADTPLANPKNYKRKP